MCFLKELRPLANVSIFSVCHVHGHASLFLDRLGFQYKLNGDDRSVPNFCVYVICICVLCEGKSAKYFAPDRSVSPIMVVKREVYFGIWRRGGSVVERRTRDLEAPSSNPTTAV